MIFHKLYEPPSLIDRRRPFVCVSNEHLARLDDESRLNGLKRVGVQQQRHVFLQYYCLYNYTKRPAALNDEKSETQNIKMIKFKFNRVNLIFQYVLILIWTVRIKRFEINTASIEKAILKRRVHIKAPLQHF